MPDFTYEQQSAGLVVGFDEAGCGPWAGPVVAAGIVFLTYELPMDFLNLINDSKRLTKPNRERAYHKLHELKGHACDFSIAHAEVQEIDTLNIRQAAMLAMSRVFHLLTIKPSEALVDGITCPKLPIAVTPIKKGDSKCYSIAAASILAKVRRDQIMAELARDFPAYGWERNAGYGTTEHQHALQIHGVTPHHRRSFAPIAELLKAA